MSYNYIELITLILLAIGCFFILSGSLGLIKLPDVFSRIHAAGLIDTLGSGFIVLALIIYSCLLYTSPSPRDRQKSRMPSSA